MRLQEHKFITPKHKSHKIMMIKSSRLILDLILQNNQLVT